MALACSTIVLCVVTAPDGRGVAFAQTDVYRCPITFVFQDDRIPPVGIVELTFDVAYEPAGLEFAGHGTAVDCTKLASTATAAFDDDDAGRLHVDLSSETGISSLIQALARCTTLSVDVPTAADFVVTILDEKKLGGADVLPLVPVELLLPEVDDCELVTTTTSTTTTSLPVERCGDPTEDSATTATDALFTLSAAVGLAPCALCACDVDGSTAVTASDALFVLSYAVGQPVELNCPPCS
jgi:hypothetical protein